MSKDKEFKAKNTDLNFEKKQNPDTVFGRHNMTAEQRTDFSVSKKNRMYQSRQTENISDNATATENTAENVAKENTNFTVPEQLQTAESVKHTQRKQADKFRADNVSEKTVHISASDNTEIQSDISPPVPKDERYNFQDAASESKQAFDIVNKNTDFRLGWQKEIPKGTENEGKAKNNKNCLYQKQQKKTVEAEQSVSSEQTERA